MKVSSPAALRILHEGSLALARVEANGIRVDESYLEATLAKSTERIRELDAKLRGDKLWRKDWQRKFGSTANLGNRQQLGEVLKDLGFKTDRVTAKANRMAVDEEFLAKVDHPFAKSFLELEKVRKVKSTYLEGLKQEIVNGRIHPFFHLNTVRSFRSSSSQPNFQNFPVRDPEQGEAVRRAIIPSEGCVLVENDFKTLEVNISCPYHKDPNLIDYVKNSPPKDMHRDMAMQIFKLDQKDVTKDSRYCGKNGFTFPSFYGSYWAQIAPRMWEMIGDKKLVRGGDGASLYDHLKEKGIRKLGSCDPQDTDEGTFAAHVRKVEKDFWGRRFKVYADWKNKFWEDYKRRGWFEYLTGFVVHGIYKKNDVTNYPIQGSAFHCLLWVLIELNKWLRKHKMKSKVIGQIHDSLLGDVWESELQDYLGKVKELVSVELPKAWKWINVPMTIEAECSGQSWHHKREWVPNDAGIWGPK